jgi:protein SCO1/2
MSIPRRTALLSIATIVTLTAAGCASSTASSTSGTGVIIDSGPSSSLFDGIQLSRALSKPDVTLTDTSGQPYNLPAKTDGHLTLLYFGYTHCPDVCPTTMANLAATLRTLTPAQRAKITVVFVTTDPARDTPPVIRAWLDQFNTAFVGLTGAFTPIQQAAASVGIIIDKPVKETNGDYQVTHGAEVLAFNTDNKAHVVWTAGETVAQLQHDLPLLLAGRDLHS